jgi:hypothetical protein
MLSNASNIYSINITATNIYTPVLSNNLYLYSSNIPNAGNCTISGTSIFNSNVGIYNSISAYPSDVTGGMTLTGNLDINGIPITSGSNILSSNISANLITSTSNIASSNITNYGAIFTPTLSFLHHNDWCLAT